MNSTLRRMVQICTVTVQLSTLQLEGVSDLEQNEVPSYQVPSYPDMSELEIAPILVILMAATLVIFPNINNLAFTSTTSDKTYAIDHSSESESALLVIPLHQLKELTCSDRGSDEQQTFSSFSEGLKEIFTTAKTLTTVILEITDADIRTATARYLLDAFKSIKNLTLVEPEGYNGRLMDEGVTSGSEFSVFEGDRLSQLESLHYGIKRSKWINIDHEVPWNHEIFEKTLIPVGKILQASSWMANSQTSTFSVTLQYHLRPLKSDADYFLPPITANHPNLLFPPSTEAETTYHSLQECFEAITKQAPGVKLSIELIVDKKEHIEDTTVMKLSSKLKETFKSMSNVTVII
ncbi:hypothetical protein C8Q75DRAFT_786699 [Abortiporus biennis]|nr:hypothetical protein C8Q75DRAFT_786699 [Abortiporus biennis]